jgi:hypothetical protein
MIFKISENMQQTVIRLWLDGKSRNYIARTCGIGEGTVSNIISDLKLKLGNGDAEALRELGSNLKRTGLDAAQCAQGHRIFMILRKLGVSEEAFESFISKVYERCMKVSALTADQIGSYLKDLVAFSEKDDNDGNPIKLSEIPQYIEQRKNEKRTLKEDIQALKIEKKVSQEEASLAHELRDEALKDEKVTVAELREYSKFKTELRNYGLSFVDDTRKLVQVIYGIKQQNRYDVDKVLSEYSDIEFMQEHRDMLSSWVRVLEDTKMRLQGECSFLKSQEDLHRQRLSVYDELKSIGLGLKQLKIILNTIKEIANENNSSPLIALDKFFEFLEGVYDVKIKSKIHEQQQKQKQQQQMQPSGYLIYGETTTLAKTSEEQSDHFNNSDQRYGSDDDQSSHSNVSRG